jgi:hypothetical protein
MDMPRVMIHRDQGGGTDGWYRTARGILALDADRFVVGHGDLQTKESLQARIDLVTAEKAQIVAGVARGETLARIQAETGDPPAGFDPRFPAFSGVVYQELTGAK